LGEHQLDKLGVTGSSPVPPTYESPADAGFSFRRRGSLAPRNAFVERDWKASRDHTLGPLFLSPRVRFINGQWAVGLRVTPAQRPGGIGFAAVLSGRRRGAARGEAPANADLLPTAPFHATRTCPSPEVATLPGKGCVGTILREAQQRRQHLQDPGNRRGGDRDAEPLDEPAQVSGRQLVDPLSPERRPPGATPGST
jgi:hypothetical protein